MYYSVSLCILMFWTALLTISHAQSCSSTVPIIVYHAQPSAFRGELTLTEHPLRSNCIGSNNQLLCPPVIILGDGDTDMEPAQPNLDDRNNVLGQIGDFLIWNKVSQHLNINIQRSSSSGSQPITAIKLNFLNYPAQNVSLPNIILQRIALNFDTSGEDIDFVLLDNEELSQDDYERTSVTLRLLTPLAAESNLLLLRWSFEGVYNVDWFFLSEVTLCADTLPPYRAVDETILFLSPEANETIHPGAQDLTSGLLLSTCTVSIRGSFIWTWRQNDTLINSGNKFQTFTADGTRTSILFISQLNFMDEATYTCEASHQIFTEASTRRSREYQVTFPVYVESKLQIMGYLGEQSVVLTCEIHGYLKQSPLYSWIIADSDQELINSQKYTIETKSGSNIVLLQDGTTGISIISVLTINNPNETDRGNYTCRGGGQEKTIMLGIAEQNATVTTAFQPEAQPNNTRVSYTITAVTSSIVTFIITTLLSVTTTLIVTYTFIRYCKKKPLVNIQEDEVCDDVYDTVIDKEITLVDLNTNDAYIKSQSN